MFFANFSDKLEGIVTKLMSMCRKPKKYRFKHKKKQNAMHLVWHTFFNFAIYTAYYSDPSHHFKYKII